MIEELKPCPFCDGDTPPQLVNDEVRCWGVVCTWCGAYMGFSHTAELAAELWNNRPIEDLLLRKLKVKEGEIEASLREHAERTELLLGLVNVVKLSLSGVGKNVVSRQAKKALTDYTEWVEGKAK